ncbi:hypothetical protein FH972_026362 [Carpinus fangiana]|uniref:JmjC domain-containing protein n=1 Tax=Carpinus fangiana TaxID=176857 RepID=A0A5N6L3R6_9ROSI|nr:hypothetical protein FH972_026362 [Carpinus fangiana]
MPAGRKKATFEPIAPDFDLSELVENTPNFVYVDRISCDMIDQQGLDAFDKLVLLHVIIAGKPLIIDGYQSRLDPWTFSSKWLIDNHGDKVENARELTKATYMPLTVGHYMKNMDKLADQFFENGDNWKDVKTRQRIYLKDIDCPPVWQDKLKAHLPPNLFYLNENTGEVGGPGALDEPAPTGGRRKGRGIANAGDLMSSLPPLMRAENLMCYLGHEGTYTPSHREMCASLGHNIMVDASDVVGDDGKPEKPGSSIWFMTETKDRQTVQEYWLSTLGHDIEVEKHFAQIAAWKTAPFTTYVVEQRPGDFILIPPLAPHQVWNRGTRTMKVAWNRTTVETLELALKEALPNARTVCRDEQYKNKAIVYYTLHKYSGLLMKARDQQQTAPSPQEAAALRQSAKIRQLQKDFKRLFHLFRDILLSETFSPDSPAERNVQFNPFDSNITCAYCRGNIFNRFLTCPSCENALGTTEPEPYDICMECYTMGRSCGCIAKFRWAEQFKWKELVQKYELWRRQYIELSGPRADTPLTLTEERAKMQTKTLAQICQEQLKIRPKIDINKPAAAKVDAADDSESEDEVETNEDGSVKKSKKKFSEAFLKSNWSCHVCCHRHEKWKMVECKCGRKWCYGTLFRGFDTMPVSIMKDPKWECPHCQGCCISGQCKNNPKQKPYEPKGTLLGHDTKLVADARSIESLVDFSVSNLTWLKESVQDAPDENSRLIRRQQEAEQAKAHDPSLEADHYVDDDHPAQGSLNEIDYETSTIDPTLDPALRLAIDPALGGPSYHQDGFVAPSAVMYRPPASDLAGDDEDESVYVEAGDGQSRKRGIDTMDVTETIKRQPVKKQRRSENIANGGEVSGASKEFRKEQERKALEEARKKGRYIMVNAALQGRSRIVRLQLDPQVLARALSGAQEEETNVLLRSDILPAPGAAVITTKPAGTQNKSKPVRIRVERDEDFGARRPRKTRPLDAEGKRMPKGYEEVEIGSDESDVEDDVAGTQGDHAQAELGRGGRRRISAWQAQRHGNDDDGPDELPKDWKDSSARAPRASNAVTGGAKKQASASTTSKASGASRSAGKTVPGSLRVPGHARVGRVQNPTSSSSSAASDDGDAEKGAQEEDDDDDDIEMDESDANLAAKLSAAGLVEAAEKNYDYDDVHKVSGKRTVPENAARHAGTVKKTSATSVLVPTTGFKAVNGANSAGIAKKSGTIRRGGRKAI